MNQPDLDDPAAWEYNLPPELIASRPAPRRDEARLMVVDRHSQQIQHRVIRDLPHLLNAGDLLVFNNTRVLPARLFGVRTATGGRWEGLFLKSLPDGSWQLLCETRGKLQPGETITVSPASEESRRTDRGSNRLDPEATPPASDHRDGISSGGSETQTTAQTFELRLIAKDEEGCWTAIPSPQSVAADLLAEFGCLPLPPYMGRRLADADDAVRYQTCYATDPGAIAAPTAGLHFTPELIAACSSAGIQSAQVTLHVGIGTFRPMNAARVSQHRMHQEWCDLPQSCCDAIQQCRARSGRVLAVGTTSVRTLESAIVQSGGELRSWRGETDLFIRPPYEFQLTDSLLTNFHLPGSTLLIMVAALAGYDLVQEAYRQAIAERYRFFSYGDAMLIL